MLILDEADEMLNKGILQVCQYMYAFITLLNVSFVGSQSIARDSLNICS